MDGRVGRRWTHRIAALLAVLALAAASCGRSGESGATVSSPATTTAPATTASPATTAAPATTPAVATTAAPGADDEYDPSLTRGDVDCSQEELESDGADYFDAFVSAHYVVDGRLGQVCFGDEDSTLLAAWELLAAVSPPSELGALAILAGFDLGDAADEAGGVTLAFVNVIGDQDGTAFQMSMNLPASEESANEFALTVAHELSHIFAGEFDQLDRDSEEANCETYFNGEGCFLPGAYLDDWVDEFWSEDELAQLDPDEGDDPEGADDRCNLNPDFLGAYAATNPDEDFAESFAAFVFGLEVDPPGLKDKMAFFAVRPELAEFRDRAEGVGLAGLPNEFDVCG